MTNQPQYYSGVCSSCRSQSYFEYIGMQRTVKDNIPIYICSMCKSTISEDRIIFRIAKPEAEIPRDSGISGMEADFYNEGGAD